MFTCTVRDLAGTAVSYHVTSVSFTSEVGDCVVLPHHEPLFVTLVPQTVFVTTKGEGKHKDAGEAGSKKKKESQPAHSASSEAVSIPDGGAGSRRSIVVKNAGVLSVRMNHCDIWVW
ncbi:MAG: hypothetical protein LBF72_00595 [Holosporales bacterium]|jgi:hypothetical protein|nr:hypothetical protein [Holosporales bacterium]